MNVENQICEAVNILINHAVSQLQFDKTILGTIIGCVDSGQGIYKVKYQDSIFTALAQGNESYRNNTSVYVTIPGNDTNKDRIIIGSLSKLGAAYTTAASKEDRLTKIGNNIFTKDVNISLCSYHGYDFITYSGNDLVSLFGIQEEDIKLYSQQGEDIMIAAKFQTALTEEQIKGNGDYGIIVNCEYYNDNTKTIVSRPYIINVNKMIGQPYRFVIPTRQYGVFPADTEEFSRIESVTAYCRNFPIEDTVNSHDDDIFISDLEFYFMSELSEEEMAGASLKIITPLGTYFNDTDNTKRLQGEIKIRGGIISPESLDDVEFYWFIRDVSISSDSSGYFPYGGVGWRCLNAKLSDSTVIGDKDTTQFENYQPAAAIKDITTIDCPSYENIFKCVAVMEDTILYDTIKIYNKKKQVQIVLSSSSASTVDFKVTSNIDITCSVLDASGTEILNSFTYYWGYEADGQELIAIDNNQKELSVNPNKAANIITCYCTVYLYTEIVGTSSITFSNSTTQKQFTLTLLNATRIYKYDESGVSPASNATEKKDRIAISPIGFEVYDRNGKIVAETDADKLSSFEMRWLWPVDHTMIDTNYPVDWLDIELYQGIECYSMPITNIGLLSFIYSIKNSFNITYTNNTIFLEVTYQGTTMAAASNLLFTKDGELGTNGTNFIARIEPVVIGESQIEKVFLHNGTWKYWIYGNNSDEILVKNGSGNQQFKIQLWDSNSNPRMDSIEKTAEISSVSWTMMPNTKVLSVNSAGQCVYNNFYGQQANILQGQLRTTAASELASSYYATYSIPVVESDSSFYYIVQGGFDHTVYKADGTRETYREREPFIIRKFDSSGVEYDIDDNDVTWVPSWENKMYTGVIPELDEHTIEPPVALNGVVDNYITITIEDSADNSTTDIIWPVHFYINRFSMAALNDWDGNGVQIEDDKIMLPQLAAGLKNNDNSFTGVAIGQTFDSSGNQNDIGLFGYNSGTRTLFLDAKTGAVTLGIPNGNSGCLQIAPSANKNQVSMKLYNATIPSWDSSSGTLTGGSGAGLTLSPTNSNLFFGNSFLLKQTSSGTKLYMEGTINATEGRIGGWAINSTSISRGNTVLGANGVISGDGWSLGNGTFTFGSSSSGQIVYDGSSITLRQVNLEGGDGINNYWKFYKDIASSSSSYLFDFRGGTTSSYTRNYMTSQKWVVTNNRNTGLELDPYKLTIQGDVLMRSTEKYFNVDQVEYYASVGFSTNCFVIGGWRTTGDGMFTSCKIHCATGEIECRDVLCDAISCTSIFGDYSAGLLIDSSAGFTINSDTEITKKLKVDGRVQFPDATNQLTAVWKSVYISQAGVLGIDGSSKRFKENITNKLTICNPLNLYKIPVVQFNFKKEYLRDPQESEIVQVGLIAEDVAEQLPNAAFYDKDGIPDGWSEKVVLVCAVKCIQEQKKEIDALKQQIKELKDEWNKYRDSKLS